MRSTFAGLALAALAAAKPVPQPQASASCSANYDGTFKIQVVTMGSKVKRGDNTALVMSLSGGVLTDETGRTGYIASNDQFQFDDPPQANALQTSGFSICGDYLAHSGDTTWDECLSGDFYNLYSVNNGGQCKEIKIQVLGDGSAASTSSAPAATSAPASSAPSSVPVTQLSDGQPQASTATAAPVTVISDGQPQAPTSTAAVAPVTVISDGQPQAPTSTAAPVTQISDGQPQAPTSTASPVTQISDGQPQAPYPTGTMSTGAIPSGTAGVKPYSSSTVPIATGAAVANGPVAGLIAAAGLAVALL